jgi:septal ring factor EnvC (AmiA/AmiB activator)
VQILKEQVDVLTIKLTRQQQHLANHLRTRYQMGDYQPLKWLLNQENPSAISRILTYYQYLIQSRQRLIDEIDTTRKNLNEKNQKLLHELTQNQQLHRELLSHQQALEQQKAYHKILISSLSNEIQTKQNALLEVKRNKNNLARLLKTLTEQSIEQPHTPFLQMQKKLPFPVHVELHALQTMKQGVTFFADEGTSVKAVYPGKIVFSDWLKGYGLLLIIDHGQGYMTLYAHNQSLFKRKGQIVEQNEQIASVGHSGGIQQNGLYFEVRHKGKAMPPLSWLA